MTITDRTAQKMVLGLRSVLDADGEAEAGFLATIVSACGDLAMAQIDNDAKIYSDNFCAMYIAKSGLSAQPIALQRFALAKRLYIRLLSRIIESEQSRLRSTPVSLLSSSTFNDSLWACSIEIVLFTYRVPWSQESYGLGATGFPWVLGVVNVQPYDFYKVIEIIIRAEDKLTGELTRHLNYIEQDVVLHQAWLVSSLVYFMLISCYY